MKYREFKKEIEDWGRTYGYVTEVRIREFWAHIKIESNGEYNLIAGISNRYPFVIDTDWVNFNDTEKHVGEELFDILVEFAKTPPEDREDEKRFIIPLPGLITSDNKQQYLTNADDTFFASRRNSKIRQTWKEEHLKYVPAIYRQFAVEFDEGKEY